MRLENYLNYRGICGINKNQKIFSRGEIMRPGRIDSGISWLSKFCAAVILVLSALFMLLLTLSAYTETANVSTNNEAGELVEIYADNVFLNILLLFLFISSLYLLYRHCVNFSLRRAELILLALVFLLGLAFIVSVKLAAPWYSDSYQVLYAAERAASNDFDALDAYFYRFPFQLGYVLYAEVLFRLMGSLLPGMPSGYYRLALQGVNLLWLLLAYHALTQLSQHLFKNHRVQVFAIILLLLCLPPVLSCTFLYGIIPGFALGAVAMWMFAAFLQQRRLWQGVLCALSLGLSVILKLNYMIFAVAICIIWMIDLLKNRGIKSLICLILTVAAVSTLNSAPQTIYERRSGKDFGQGIPMLAWVAMGMSEGYAGPGWYKEDNTVKVFMETGMDAEATEENAISVIQDRAAYFSVNPSKAWDFFWEKLRSQWNEPTYESLWINQVQSSYGEKGRLYEWFCGAEERLTITYMNQYQQLIFLGTLLSCIYLFIKRDILQCLPILAVLGGILYHLLSEAKSQYALPYFILMVPLAAYGFCGLFHSVEHHSAQERK